MKKYVAVVVNENGIWTTIISEYNSKKDFIHDLKKNGYTKIVARAIRVIKREA